MPPKGNNSTKHTLAVLTRASATGLVTTDQASKSLGISRRSASLRLAALARGGWVARVRRGTYIVLPLEAASSEVTTPEDPWALATVLYSPCYVGGWSAAEHWKLTEQFFRSTFVVTSANIRQRAESFLGAEFHLAKVPAELVHGLRQVWRSSSRILVSSAERTLVDAAVHPAWVGGGRQLAGIFAAYRELSTRDENALAHELALYGNGAAAKRIGYLAERLWPEASRLIDACLAARTSGISRLDPAVSARGNLITRWNLWNNVRINEASRA